jgi:phosphoribosylformylglycinamidine synthase
VNTYTIQLMLKDNIPDVSGKALEQDAKRYFNINTGKVRASKVFTILTDKSGEEILEFAEQTLKDAVLHDVYMDKLLMDKSYERHLFMAKLPGVTDDEGVSAQKTYADYFNLDIPSGEQFIFTGEYYYIEKSLSDEDLKSLGNDLLGNPLINHIEYGPLKSRIDYVPTVLIKSEIKIDKIEIELGDDELLELSKNMLLSLDLKEMQTIRDYFLSDETQAVRKEIGMSPIPTDCELEVLGQTWSEHCKHKEFNAIVTYKDLDTGEEKKIDSLFKTYIYNSTKVIRERFEKSGNDWILKVFNDNAGVVKIDDEKVFIWKVETHNSPSALDPYGGALTGIVGVNRDPMGTGIGGGKCLFNTNVLCFGSPYYDGELLEGQLHPRRIMSGVVKGIEDGGNKSGIPTINGSIVFDDRFRGKPLV